MQWSSAGLNSGCMKTGAFWPGTAKHPHTVIPSKVVLGPYRILFQSVANIETPGFKTDIDWTFTSEDMTSDNKNVEKDTHIFRPWWIRNADRKSVNILSAVTSKRAVCFDECWKIYVSDRKSLPQKITHTYSINFLVLIFQLCLWMCIA
jgi:hypothetical protein